VNPAKFRRSLEGLFRGGQTEGRSYDGIWRSCRPEVKPKDQSVLSTYWEVIWWGGHLSFCSTSLQSALWTWRRERRSFIYVQGQPRIGLATGRGHFWLLFKDLLKRDVSWRHLPISHFRTQAFMYIYCRGGRSMHRSHIKRAIKTET
jgi:hypothetical protein